MKQTTKLIKIKFIVFIFLFLYSFEIFARAGGGGGKGGGAGGIIGYLIWGIYTLLISIILFYKVGKSKRIISINSREDSFWNFNEMRDLARNVFIIMQDSWMDRNIDLVKSNITVRLYEEYKVRFEIMKKNGEKNVLSSINITDVRIIGCEDYLDNNKDCFIAHIKGEMVDFTINENTNMILNNPERKSEKFADLYYFDRKDKKWLLDYIDNDVSVWDTIMTRNYHEEK